MSTYACSIIDTFQHHSAQRMYIDLGDYRYGLTMVGTGKPLVCLHGFSESSYTWDSIIVPGYQMIRIDTIGHGDSDIPEDVEAFTIPRMLDDLHMVITAIAGESCALMGYSMGARLALLYALHYGDESEQLILESGSVGIANDAERATRREKDDELAHHIEHHDGAWFATKWAEVPIFASQKRLPLVMQERIWARRAHNSPYALAETLRQSGQGVMPYVGHRLQELSMNSLYISGALDTKYTTIGRDVFGSLPNFHHVIVEQAGHNVHVEAPGQFMTALTEFLYKKG